VAETLTNHWSSRIFPSTAPGGRGTDEEVPRGAGGDDGTLLGPERTNTGGGASPLHLVGVVSVRQGFPRTIPPAVAGFGGAVVGKHVVVV
jgi:hypothetical protein